MPGMLVGLPAGTSGRNMDGDVHSSSRPSSGDSTASAASEGRGAPPAAASWSSSWRLRSSANDADIHTVGSSVTPGGLAVSMGSNTRDTHPNAPDPILYVSVYLTPRKDTARAAALNVGTPWYMSFSRSNAACMAASSAVTLASVGSGGGAHASHCEHRVAVAELRNVHVRQNHGSAPESESGAEKSVPHVLHRADPAEFSIVHVGQFQSTGGPDGADAPPAPRRRPSTMASCVDTGRHAMTSYT